MSAGRVVTRATRIESRTGHLFLTCWVPHGTPVVKAVLIVPPFAEEMNKSRRMMAVQGRALARVGVATVCVDPFGTGDSEGEFSAASWEDWSHDVRASLDWVAASFAVEGVWVLGVRSGALLALAACGDTQTRIDGVVLWAPTYSGKAFLTQFLRIQVAAAATIGREDRRSTSELWQELASGRSVDVAGYEISSALAIPMGQSELADLVAACRSRVSVIEVSAIGLQPSPAAQKFLARFADRDQPVEVSVVEGDPFWSTAEIVEIPALIDRTLDTVWQSR